ncbi:MAG TPA: hypothetical protein VHG93_26260 [Longimicrobium sp.]|nr:hypothetical protein [Longimicrobium sp.]
MRPISLLAIIVCDACAGHAEPATGPHPAPAEAPRMDPASSARERPPIPEEVCRCIRICVVQRGQLVEVPVIWVPATGDTLTQDSLPFSHVYPVTGEYASVAGWYLNNEPMRLRRRIYRRHAQPRVLGVNEVVRVDDYRGVPVFAEAADTASAAFVVYVPTRQGCEFQPYMNADSVARRARGAAR